MQAIILAAGMGKRLKELTSNNTKCMVRVNGVTLIERMLSQLDALKLSKIVIVIGYEGQKLVEFINTLKTNTPIEYVDNPIYYKTNNIYSLALAKEHLVREDTLLLESDLIYEDAVLKKIIDNPYPSLALVAKFESWMDGTVVTLDDEDNIRRFIPNRQFSFEEIPSYYKTVNIYKFSRDFSTTHYVPFLDAYCAALGRNEYYEQVLRVITLLDRPEIKAVRLENEAWYEIDDLQDLDIAESIFAPDSDKLEKIQKRYGGYWRYPGMVDFCYLVNPYFPTKKLIDEIKANFERLLGHYPSGLRVNNLLAAKYFGVSQDHICIGNGAAELIKGLMASLTGKIGMIFPTFEEYPNRYAPGDIVAYRPGNDNFTYDAASVMGFFADKDISTLTLINPDNPSGNFIPRQGVLELAQWAAGKSITLIVDESFVDFADTGGESSLLEDDILRQHDNLVVVKSISKSFGVPGLRLGILASGSPALLEAVKKEVAIWNINSFAEFYMQIFEKYKGDYQAAMKLFMDVRRAFLGRLQTIARLRVVPTQANYVLCEVLAPHTARQLTQDLLIRHNIFIKDLSGKRGFDGGEYIRIAVRTRQDNDMIADRLQAMLA